MLSPEFNPTYWKGFALSPEFKLKKRNDHSMLSTLKFIWQHPVSKHHRFAATKRFLKWQIASRVIQRPIMMPFIEGSVLFAEKSMTGATGNIYCGLHEFTDMALCLHYLRPEDTFVDIGANIGSYTVLASKVAGAKTITIEPVPTTFEKLQLNILGNRIHDKVTAHNVAIGTAKGTVRFSIDQDTVNSVVDEKYAGKSMEIPVMAIDEILADLDTVLWKIDVEGYEKQTIQGALNSLKRKNPNLLILESDSPEIQSTLNDHGFQRYHYDAIKRNFHLHQANQSNEPGNCIWIKDIATAEQRCKTAKRFNVNGFEF